MKASGDDYQVTVTEDEPIVPGTDWTAAYLYDRRAHHSECFDA